MSRTCMTFTSRSTLLVAAIALLAAPHLHARETVVLEEEFADGLGAFRLNRAAQEDLRLADGALAIIGQNDGNVRDVVCELAAPLDGRARITVRQRADEGAYGGLYLFSGGRNVIQLGVGQGREREGVMLELDNFDRDLNQRLFPDMRTKQAWRDYVIEVDGEQVSLTIDGELKVATTYSGRPVDRIAIWNGMNSLGALETERISVVRVREVAPEGPAGEPLTVLEESFEEELGAFRPERAVPDDLRVEDGVFSITGRRDGEVRAVRAELGVPLVGRASVLVRQRADEGAYGGLYIFSGTRNIIQLGVGQGRGGEGVMLELDNFDRERNQRIFPDIGTKQQWREYLIEVDGEQIALTVDGERVVETQYSGNPISRISIWNGMNSLGDIQTDRILVRWQPAAALAPVEALRDDFTSPDTFRVWHSPTDVPEWSIVPDEGTETGTALHSDYRRYGNWTLANHRPIRLEANTQYSLKIRLRGVSGVMAVRLALEQAGVGTAARIDTRSTSGYIEREATFLTGPRPGLAHMVLSSVWGGGTVWIDWVALERTDPPRSPYETGVNLLHNTVGEAGGRVGLVIEAEDAAPPDITSAEDVDGDGKWALVKLEMPERVISDIAVNPWGFANNTVLKSDLAPGGDPVRLRFPMVIPGRYRAYLGDPRRDAALLVNGEWRRIEGGRGEVDLGVVQVDDDFEVAVAHRHVTEANPGPVYLDYARFLPLHDEEQIAATARRVHEARLAAREASWNRAEADFAPVTLTVPERAGIARTAEPVITGVPFAAGALHAGARLRLSDAGGAPQGFHAEPLVHWPDGSVKWLRLRFLADVPAGGEGRFVLEAAPEGRELTRPVPEEELGPEAVIETAALRLALGSGLIHEARAGGGPVLAGPATLRLHIGDQEAQGAALGITGYRLLERHDLATMVAFEGDVQWDGPPLGVQGRLTVEETRPAVTLEFWLVHKDRERRIPLHEAVLTLGTGPAAARVTAGLDEGVREAPFGDGWELVQLGRGDTVAAFEGQATLRDADGQAAWEGERVPGWLLIGGEGGSIALGVREFVERFPKAIGAGAGEGGTALSFAVWPAEAPEPFVWNQGAALAHHLGLAFLPPQAGADEARRLLAATMHPLRVVLAPEVYCNSGAFGVVTPQREQALYPNHEQEVARAFGLIVEERSSWGMEDFGGVFQPGGYVPGTERMWTNMEYDFSHAALSQFARTGDVAYLERADQATRHFVPVDIYHWSPTERIIGASHTHSHTMEMGHQVGGANFGHGGWPQGPLQVYYLTGERQGLDAGVLLGGYIARNAGPRPEDTGGRPMYGLREERDAGNAILSTITTYEATNAPELLEVAYRVLDFVERCQTPGVGNWDTPVTEDPPHRGTTFMFHQLIKGLDAMQQVTGEPRIEEIFRKSATWFLEHSSDEDGRYAFKFSPRYWRGASVRTFAHYALGFERAAHFSDPETARALRQKARESMDAIFGPAEGEPPNVQIEAVDAEGRRRIQHVYGGETGQFRDYALTVRDNAAVLEVDGETAWEGIFSGEPARWVRLWSGTASQGPIDIESFAVERLGPDGAPHRIAEFNFDRPEDLDWWRARVPADTDSRIELADGRLRLVDAERALMGAELDLPEDLGAQYRILWRQHMPEGQYGGLMVFGPGEFQFDLYQHRPVAILHVGLNQGGGYPFRGMYDNPRSFAPLVTYINQVLSAVKALQ